VEAGIFAAVEARQVGEGLGEVMRIILLVKILVDAADGVGDDLRVGRIDAIGNVVIVASVQFSCHSVLEEIRKFLDRFRRVLDYNETDRAMLDKTRKPNMFRAAMRYFTSAGNGGE
jgi:hypothetical protein